MVDSRRASGSARVVQTWRGSGTRPAVALWSGVPRWARVVFLAGVFCAFSIIGFVNDIIGLGGSPPARLAYLVVSCGLMAVAYAICAFRGVAYLVVAVGVQALLIISLNAFFPFVPRPLSLGPAALQALRARLMLDGVGCLEAMVLSYVFFSLYIKVAGRLYFRTHTELKLAERIHRSLVPPVRASFAGLAVYGESTPSGQVGGDLVDFVQSPDGWTALVFDVSGHGVPSGVLTAMVKSAARVRLRASMEVSSLLVELNEMLVPIIEPNMFVTGICLSGTPTGTIALAAAGHPPALHYRRATGDVLEYNASSLALGIRAGQTYPALTVRLDPGDVLVLLTDGLLEVFDDDDREFGLAGVAGVLRANGHEPPDTLATRIRDAALAHGSQMDDQTLLVISAASSPVPRGDDPSPQASREPA